jgi:hypothetical protein
MNGPLFLSGIKVASNARHMVNRSSRKPDGAGFGRRPVLGTSEGFWVVTDTLTDAAVPDNWIGLVTMHVVVAGAPEHAMVTAPEYPVPGVSCKVY